MVGEALKHKKFSKAVRINSLEFCKMALQIILLFAFFGFAESSKYVFANDINDFVEFEIENRVRYNNHFNKEYGCIFNELRFRIEIKTEVLDDCDIYGCYLSHLDRNFNPTEDVIWKNNLELNNINDTGRDNETTSDFICNRKKVTYTNWNGEKFWHTYNENAWHGWRLQSHSNGTVQFSNSFSDEVIVMEKSAIGETIRMHFGTKDSMYLKFTNENKEEIPLRGDVRIPPEDLMESPQKFFLEAFQKDNLGAWLIPLDMAHVNSVKKSWLKSRTMYFVGHCKIPRWPKIKVVGLFDSDNKEYSLEFVPKFTEDVIETSTETTGASTQSTDTPPDESTTPILQKTWKSSVGVCKTIKVNVKPAIIRDRLADLPSQCDVGNPEQCKVHIDYAVRLGCVNCTEGIDDDQQTIFLDALYVWIEQNNMDGWIGTNFHEFLDPKINPDEPQTIWKVEAGGLRYFSVPNDWIGEDVHMLVHDCDKFGLFASALHKGKSPENHPDIEALFNWEKDFEFLENCKFLNKLLRKSHYVVGKLRYYKFSVGGIDVGFGTLKKNEQTGKTECFMYPPQQREAHKFKFGFSDPLRDSPFLKDFKYTEERYNDWGPFVAPAEEIYGNYTEHEVDITYKRISARVKALKYELYDEDVPSVSVVATLNQMTIRCGNVYARTPRLQAEQEVTYNFRGTPLKKTITLYNQAYEIDLDDKTVLKDEGI